MLLKVQCLSQCFGQFDGLLPPMCNVGRPSHLYMCMLSAPGAFRLLSLLMLALAS